MVKQAMMLFKGGRSDQLYGGDGDYIMAGGVDDDYLVGGRKTTSYMVMLGMIFLLGI